MSHKLKIGVALGSGAAKGWAHIGVLRGLAKMDVHPEVVAGCSIGAFVGAAYAADRLDELEEWVRSFSTWDVMGLMDLSWRRGGLIEGEKVFEAASKAIDLSDISEVKRPFLAVATDLYTGQEVWLDEGKLSDVVRASCSIPGLMSPKHLGNRWLVDGAVVNPVPVSPCRTLGADLVIAVDLHGDGRQHVAEVVNMATPVSEAQVERQKASNGFMDLLVSGRELLNRVVDSVTPNNHNQPHPNMLAVMHQSMEILEQRHKRARLMGDPPEVMVLPHVGAIGTMEFQRAEEAIDAGEAAVMKVQNQIEAEIDRMTKARNGH
ncbi:patatin-like phospholipase RssA [Ferrimonas balearica]|uniref:patatin-like phospholipase RssA n=1 Tax=Ferrimonas balearica TaxID=44012 RepID=UPI001C9984F2|nr:patatin-like phospholipase RssA [Ferrimonas balearica]MBY5922092.1 patatin-like phospholipase RssA [Ferrimonas balearica]MBY5994568.1 patatin-like phospholipase RssA [Ferrimonas balearica]